MGSYGGEVRLYGGEVGSYSGGRGHMVEKLGYIPRYCLELYGPIEVFHLLFAFGDSRNYKNYEVFPPY